MMVNQRRGWGIGLGFLVGLLLLPSLNGISVAADYSWPKRFVNPEASVVLYQPQLETFQGDKLTARSAVSVQKKGEKQPIFGVVWFSARVATDRDTRMATIEDVNTTNVKFADAKPEQDEKIRAFLQNEVKDWQVTMSLDRIVAAMDKVEEAMRADSGLNTEPPKILFVTSPAVLVPLDGDPKLLPLPDPKLMRVANTAFLMVYDPEEKTYYLRGGEDWLSATDVKGPWKEPGALPANVDALRKEIEKDSGEQGAKQGRPKKVESVQGKMPRIIVSTEPTELLVTEGEPQYTPIQGTDLLYVSNSDSNIFLYSKTQEHIVLISGRWFKSKSLTEGPWTYVAPNALPADFAKIPESSIKGFVLVNVAGTPQAVEAVHEMYIPQTAAIDRKKATTQVTYDGGEPKWESIPGTDLDYAVNTGQTVFKEGTKYYAVEQGAWYESTSPNGPWKVCVSPPAKVKDIPPSNPHYNAKYVNVYDSTEDTAHVGYTPGYTGSYVQNGTVVYGTGYQYPAYATPTTYVPYPSTYGYSAVYDPYVASWGYQPAYYNPYAWLGAAITTAAVVGLTWAAWDHFWDHGHHRWYGGGYWGVGGYRYANVNYIHNTVIHNNWRSGRPGYGAGWNRPGWDRPGNRPGWDRPGSRPGRPETLPAVRPGDRPWVGASQRPNLYNRPYNQANLAERPGRPGAKPGEVRPGQAEGRPSQAGARPEQMPGARPGKPGKEQIGGEGFGRPATQSTRPAKGQAGKNNVFADKEGNVYRKTDKGWQQREGGKWSSTASQAASRTEAATRPGQRPQAATKERPTRSGFDANGLNRDFNQRQRGEARTNQFQRSNAASSFNRQGGGAGRSRGETVGGGSRGGGRGGGGGARSAGGGGGGKGGARGGGGGGRGR